jgi:radical SAM protein with 4Fe4S-binding SPASM domain
MDFARKLKSLNVLLQPKHLYYGPQWLVLGVNNICNLHCKMCDVGTKTNDTNFAVNLVGTQPLNMPLELICKVFDEAALHFPKTKIGYAFTEPLVYPHLIESLAYAKSKGLFTSVTTNALTLLKHAPELCRVGLDELCISLDGPEEVHNFIRGHKSSFQRAIAGIEAMLTHEQRPTISIFCVITEWNTGRLKEFADYFRDFPLKQLGFMHTVYATDAIVEHHNRQWGKSYPATVSNVAETDVSTTNLPELWGQIQSIKSDRYPFPVTFSPEIASEEKLDVFYNHPEILIGKRCNDAFSTIMIKSDGSVIPAHGRCFNYSLGNLHNQSLAEIWNSKEAGTFRHDLMQAGGLFPACSRCCSAF